MEAKGVIQLSVQQQAAIRADGRTMERELHGAVKLKPQRAGLRFTRRVRRQSPAPLLLTSCDCEIITLGRTAKLVPILDIRVNTNVR